LGLNKKAIIFTMIAVLMSLLFTIIFAPNYQLPYDHENDAIRLRVLTLDQFAKDFENYAEFALELKSYEVLEALIERAADKKKIYFENYFESCITKNTMGVDNCSSTGQNVTIYNALDKIVNLSRNNLSIQLAYRVNKVDITQENPWKLRARMNITYYITDVYAEWERTKIITSDVSIEDLKDPIYALNKTYNNTFKQNKVAVTEWNITKLQAFYDSKEYRYNPRAPSFIDRVEYNLTGNSTCCGIESLVDITQTGFKPNRTFVDYELFANHYYSCLTELKRINGFTPSQFTLDINRLIEFRINSTVWSKASCS
jgi:hypothetical protein